MQTVALGIYLTETTRNPLWLGLLTVSAYAPAIIGAPVGGVVADRWSRQRWIQLNNSVMACTAIALAVAALTHHLSPSLACYLAVGEGLCNSASSAAWQSLLPDLVEPDEVLAAVSLTSAQFNLGRVIGPVLASIALVVGSVGVCFLANAISFVFVLVIFSFVRTPPRARPNAKVRFFAEIWAGVKRTWYVKGCRNPTIGVGLISLLAAPFITLIPAMAIIALHSGKIGTTWLVASLGAGSVIGALTLPIIAKRTSRIAVLRGSIFALAGSLIVYSLSPVLILSALVMVVLGGAHMGTLTGLNTSVQVHAPIAERSRILAIYTLSLSLAYSLGAFVQSDLARVVGVRPVTLVAALVLLVTLVAITLARPQLWRDMGSPIEGPLSLAD